MNKNVVSIYNKIANKYHKTFFTPSNYLDDFLRYIPKKRKILDIGCGVGVDSSYVKSKGYIPTGIDISKKMLEIAKKNNPQLDFRLSDMRKLNFKNDSYNGIIVSYSLIHIPKNEVPKVISNFYKILKKNGIIYLGLQSGKSREVFIDEPFKHGENLFLNIMSLKEIKEILEKEGFRIIFCKKKNSKVGELNFTKLFIIAKK